MVFQYLEWAYMKIERNFLQTPIVNRIWDNGFKLRVHSDRI